MAGSDGSGPRPERSVQGGSARADGIEKVIGGPAVDVKSASSFRDTREGAPLRPLSQMIRVGPMSAFRSVQLRTEKSLQPPGTPFRACSPRSSKSSPDPATRMGTAADTHTSPGEAAARTRAAMCTPIPAMSDSLISTSPVCRPSRMAMPRGRRASPRASAQRMARPGPSNVARTPSPVDFKIRPWCWSIKVREMASWVSKGFCHARSPSSTPAGSNRRCR